SAVSVLRFRRKAADALHPRELCEDVQGRRDLAGERREGPGLHGELRRLRRLRRGVEGIFPDAASQDHRGDDRLARAGRSARGRPDRGDAVVVEQNLIVRMTMRRFTRLTNTFSKKRDSHKAMIVLHDISWRIRKTLREIPTMEAGKADHVWSLEEIAGLAKSSFRRSAWVVMMPSIISMIMPTTVNASTAWAWFFAGSAGTTWEMDQERQT